MVIELTDVNTEEVETIVEENMVTNAVNNLFGINPMAVLYSVTDRYDSAFLWESNLLPICPNMIGGILLFPNPITENADNIYLSSANLPVAYASNDVNATINTRRGSLNLTESMALSNGYKFVWEFTPSQGNGTIAAVGLTSKQGGANAYGSEADDTSAYFQIRKAQLPNTIESDLQDKLFRIVELDFENGLLYCIGFVDSTVIIWKFRIPVFDIGLNERLNETTLTLLDTTVLRPSTFCFQGSYTPCGDFLDGRDGYWYGFANSGNSTGNATVLWIKIKKSDLSFTEGSWTLSNVTIPAVGSYKFGSGSPQRITRDIIRNGYLYVPANDNTGIYKINLANSTDVTLISFGFTSIMRPLGGYTSCENYLALIGDLIIGYDFQIDVNDNVIRTVGAIKFENMGTPLFQYKHFIFYWGANYSYRYRYAYMLMPYLATINNLSQAVVKNADKTMRITYTLTETESSS